MTNTPSNTQKPQQQNQKTSNPSQGPQNEMGKKPSTGPSYDKTSPTEKL